MNRRIEPYAGLLSAGTALMTLAAVAGACSGGSSNSQVSPGNDSGPGVADSASSSGGGSGGSSSSGSSGSSGSSSNGSSGGASGSSSGSGGSSSGSAGSGGQDAGACPHATSLIEGAHVTMTVTWPSTLSTNQGSGTIDIWLLASLSVTGPDNNLTLSGKTQTCGTTLPPIALNVAGQLVTGGSKVQITLPDSIWNAPSTPKFDIQGMASGWDPGSTISFNPVLAPIGVTLSNPTAPWPSSSWTFPSGTPFPDADSDGKPGITAVPVSGNGFVLPPTGLGALGSAPTADKIYIVSRNELSLGGTRTSCNDASGMANVTYFDNHVVGCHILNGSECTTGMANTQADFVDQSRTVYAVGGATFVTKQLATTASCADVLAALP
jgi:hypothetical protein